MRAVPTRINLSDLSATVHTSMPARCGAAASASDSASPSALGTPTRPRRRRAAELCHSWRQRANAARGARGSARLWNSQHSAATPAAITMLPKSGQLTRAFRRLHHRRHQHLRYPPRLRHLPLAHHHHFRWFPYRCVATVLMAALRKAQRRKPSAASASTNARQSHAATTIRMVTSTRAALPTRWASTRAGVVVTPSTLTLKTLRCQKRHQRVLCVEEGSARWQSSRHRYATSLRPPHLRMVPAATPAAM